MVEIHLYGKLRRYAENARPRSDTVVFLDPGSVDSLDSLLKQLGVPADEINHIFVNAKLLATRNRVGSFYGYPQSGPDLSRWDLDVTIADGDRIGLFGRDMAVLGM
ncbi:MAG: hypothetical protein P8129_11005 [Anaerolineae bacterium]|jgi:hypothetical protein